MVKGGYSADKMHVLCNFIDVSKVQNPSLKKEDYYVFLGRVNSVLGARIGGIPELIEEGVSGMTFASGDVEDLKAKISEMFAAEFDYAGIASAAQARYNAEAYYEKIMKEYEGL